MLIRSRAPRRWLVAGLFVALLAGAAYKDAASSATRLHAAALSVLAIGVALFAAGTADERGRRGRVQPTLLLLAAILLLGVVVGQRLEALPWADRGAHVVYLFAVLGTVPALGRRGRAYLRANAAYVLAAGAVLGLYLFHAGTLSPASGRAAFAVYTGVLFVMCLLFVPQYVPRNVFLWTVAGLSGVLVLVALPVYAVGAYSLGPLPIRTWDATVGLGSVSTDVPVLRSAFANPNTLGILAFAGTVAALVLAVDGWRAWRRTPKPTLLDPFPEPSRDPRDLLSAALAGSVLALNAVGLLLSMSRAGMLAAVAAGVVYLAWVHDGPRGLALGVATGLGGTVLLLWGIYAGLLPLSPSSRFQLWAGALAAIGESPAAFGHGIVATGEFVAPYVDASAAGHAPHNAYLSTVVKVGLVGGAAYLLLTVGNVLDAAAGTATGVRPVSPAALALSTGFVVHQVFESYSLYHHGLGAVLATLAFGFLLDSRVDERRESASRASGEARPASRVTERREATG